MKRATDPIRGRGRIPLVKRRSAGHPEFRPAGVPTVSVLEAKIADAVLGAMQSIPHQTFLDSVERGDADGYAATVLNRLSEASAAIEEALMEAFIVSGETSALEVGKDLAREYSKVGKAADVPLPSEVALQFRFDRTDPRATAWVRNEAGQLITNMTNESRLLIRNVIGDAFESQRTWAQTGRGIFAQLATITPSPSVRDYADVLGANLNGLTTRYERAVVNRVTALADDYAARGITGTKALQGMRKEGDRYAERLRRSRSRTIARTERMRAHNEARLLSYQQAIDSGLASSEHSRKEWQTGPFDVCPICVSTAGQKVKVNEGFTLPNGRQVMAPPAHPNCRCSMTMLTDTRLYEPSDRLGTGLPGDPFR
ncbi:MAG: phage minor head protein, partial [Ilumatobacteraceae bacterium]